MNRSKETRSEGARRLAEGVDRLLETEIPEDRHFWHKHDEVATVRGKAIELTDSRDIDEARLRFADLSVALSKLVRATGVPPTYRAVVQELHCPMYRDGQGGSIWLQPEGRPRNPFYGSIMLECFDERTALPVTGGTPVEEPSVEPPPDASPATTTLDISAQKALDRLAAAYLVIQEMLTRDETAGADERLQAIGEAATALAETANEAVAGPAERIALAASEQPGDLPALRGAFEAVSDGLVELLAAMLFMAIPFTEQPVPARTKTR